MKKQYYVIVAIMLMLCSLSSFASVQTFWARGSSDKASFKKARYVHNIYNSRKQKKVSIPYKIENNWKVNSASLWLKLVDDFKGVPCSRRLKTCGDRATNNRDSRERIRITNIEGRRNRWAEKEVNSQQWVEMLDVTTFLINDTNNLFKARLRAIRGKDYLYRNAKLVIDYDINAATTPTAPVIDFGPPVVVPLPPALWLFWFCFCWVCLALSVSVRLVVSWGSFTCYKPM